MDLILSAFCKTELSGLTEIELNQFEALLDLADQDLYYWITGAQEVPEQHRTDLLTRLQTMPPVVGVAPS